MRLFLPRGATTTRYGTPVGEHYPNCRSIKHWWSWRCDCAVLEIKVASSALTKGLAGAFAKAICDTSWLQPEDTK